MEGKGKEYTSKNNKIQSQKSAIKVSFTIADF